LSKYERYLKIAADRGVWEAKKELAKWHFDSNDKQRHFLAFSSLKALSHEGVLTGLEWFLLGQCYAQGKGVAKSLFVAMPCFRKGADCGDLSSQLALARMYEEELVGKIPEAKEQALKYWTMAANQGDPDALCALGKAHAERRLVNASAKKAFELWQKAAAKNHAESIYLVGICFYKGLATQPDHPKAVACFQAAAERFPKAWHALGCAFAEGRGVEKSSKLALEAWQKGADQNDSEAQFALGRSYLYGVHGLQKSYEKAIPFLRAAAAQNLGQALHLLGFAYLSGWGVEQSDDEAADCFRRSAEQNCRSGLFSLGIMYLQGRGGLEKSEPHAIKYLKQASDSRLINAHLELACLFQKNGADDTAFIYWKRAADQGDKQAQFQTGIALLEGISVERSEEEAIAYLERAAEQGHLEAKEKLAEIGRQPPQKRMRA
jgi:TPR repeat protein